MTEIFFYLILPCIAITLAVALVLMQGERNMWRDTRNEEREEIRAFFKACRQQNYWSSGPLSDQFMRVREALGFTTFMKDIPGGLPSSPRYGQRIDVTTLKPIKPHKDKHPLGSIGDTPP